jgi:hypothetical protein
MLSRFIIFFLFAFFLCPLSGQMLKDFQEVKVSGDSIQNAFSRVLENISAMSEDSSEVQLLKRGGNKQDYENYLDFVFHKMSYTKIKNYIHTISDAINKIDFGSLSKNEEKDFKFFLQTGYIDEYHFYISEYKLSRYGIPKSATLKYEQSDIQYLSEKIEKLKLELIDLQIRFQTLDSPEEERRRRFEELYKERDMLNHKQNVTYSEFDKIQKRLEELRQLEKDIREKPTPLSIEYYQLRNSIDKHKKELQEAEQKMQEAIFTASNQADKNYRDTMQRNINNMQIWIDFFDDKNSVILDYLVMIGTSENLTKIIENNIPQKDIAKYKKELSIFASEWHLSER